MAIFRVTCKDCGYQRDIVDIMRRAKWWVDNMRKEDGMYKGNKQCPPCQAEEIRRSTERARNGCSA
jgi:transposase-like protein